MVSNSKTLKIISPAKVNLFLAVGKKHGEFHPVLNVMHSLLLHDVIYMNYAKSNKLEVSIEFLENEDSNGNRPDIRLEDNLIYKAIMQLAEASKNTNYHIEVFVEKNIPLQAGLAGGSSNAAAALVGAAKIFGCKDEDLVTAAAKVGSDVAFFLNGGCALYKGRGEIFDHKISPINREIVIVKPLDDQGLSTKDVYAQFDKMNVASDFTTSFSVEDNCDCKDHNHEHKHDHSMNLEEATSQLQFADNVLLFNNLAIASESLDPRLSEIKSWLVSKCGEENVLLCGSGSATFAMIGDACTSEEIIDEAKSMGYWAISTQLANVKCKIVPNVVQY